MRALTDILFPHRCFGCGVHLLRAEVAARVCDACAFTCHRVGSPQCPICARMCNARDGEDRVCSRCADDPPAFSKAQALWVYDGAVADAIRRSKAACDPATMFALLDGSRGVLDAIAAQYADWSWTTPPPHPKDLRQRGWDSARCALRHALPRIRPKDPVRRTTRSKKQSKMRQMERFAAMKDAFKSSPVDGRWVLFDDVMTTGATANAIARSLVDAGASEVHVVAIARSL